MNSQLTGVHKVLFIIALFSTNFVMMTDYVIFPITDALYAAFPGSTAGVNFIISGPSLIIVFASLVVPVLLRRIDKKVLIIAGCIAFAITSIGGCLIEAIPYMIACRIVGGACYATVQICVVGIIADYWVDEKRRASIMGYNNAAQAVAGTIMSFVSGNLAVSGWQNSYNTYWIIVPVIVLVIIFIPRLKTAETLRGGSPLQVHAKTPLGISFWLMIINFAVLTISFFITMASFISVYVAQNDLGTSAFSGMLASMTTIGSATLCMCFGFIYRKLKSYTSIPFFFILASCILLLYFFPHPETVTVACLLAGGCFGSMFSYAYAYGLVKAQSDNLDRAASIVTATYGIAMFGSTYFMTFIMEVMGTGSVQDAYIVPAILCLLSGIIEVLRQRIYK